MRQSGKDGAIFQDSALTAVKQWTYTAYYLET
jgi:hypothetical protein